MNAPRIQDVHSNPSETLDSCEVPSDGIAFIADRRCLTAGVARLQSVMLDSNNSLRYFRCSLHTVLFMSSKFVLSFAVLTPVSINIDVSRDVTPCR